DLSPVLPREWLAECERFESRVCDLLPHAALDHVELEQLDHRLDAERPGLHGILEEVRLEEPLVRVDVLVPAERAEARGAAVLPDLRAVEHQEHRLRE